MIKGKKVSGEVKLEGWNIPEIEEFAEKFKSVVKGAVENVIRIAVDDGIFVTPGDNHKDGITGNVLIPFGDDYCDPCFEFKVLGLFDEIEELLSEDQARQLVKDLREIANRIEEEVNRPINPKI